MKLWSKNFSLLTVGSFLSSVGAAAAGITFSFLIFNETKSPFMLALFVLANILPRIIVGFLAGPIIDRHSRRVVIFSLEIMITVIYLSVGGLLLNDFFNAYFFILLNAFLGTIDTIYQLAFLSLFQAVIPNKQYYKAYIVSGFIGPVTSVIIIPFMTRIAIGIENGISYILLFAGTLYLISAVIKRLIVVNEVKSDTKEQRFRIKEDLKEGFSYYKKEKGILGIGILFMIFALGSSSRDLLTMPFIVESGVSAFNNYGFIIVANNLGRVIGSVIQYLIVYPPKIKYYIAVCVYLFTEAVNGVLLYLPFNAIIVMSFLIGLLSVTSFNIRISGTQMYIPDKMRARVNAVQNLLSYLGTIVGALVAGIIAENWISDYRQIFLFTAVIAYLGIIFIPIRMKKDYAKILNV